VQACRIDFGAQTVGIVLIGHVIGDEVPLAVHQHTGSTAVVTVDERAVAVSPLAGGRPAEAGELDDVTAGLGPELREIEVAGSHYLARGGQLPGYSGEREVAFAVLRSLDEALAPGRRLTHSVLAIAGLALVGAFLLAIPISRRLSRTVDQLVQFTARVGKGDLDARAAVAGAAEVKLLASAMNQMVSELHESRRELARKERLEREMEIAMRIQTSILPTSFEVHGLDIAAHMVPASEVGGDYYDVLPVHDGCWIGIGDVAGHGLTAGLEMLMVQSVVAALVRENPDAAPKSHLHVLNQVIFDNIRNRLKQDEHVTLTLLRYRSGGAIDFAGAHEDILICRAGADKCVRVMTPGTWVGAVRDISQFTKDSSIELEPGALMVLYSDGVTEARDGAGEQFGIERLEAEIERSRREPVGVIRDRVVAAVEAWQASQEDDISIVVLRRKQPQKG
jgi:sigma-B regulation protein RsbU (phosphoserine phosphatase)